MVYERMGILPLLPHQGGNGMFDCRIVVGFYS